MAEGGQGQGQAGQAPAPQFLAMAPGDIQALGQAIANGIIPPAPAAQAPSGVRKIPLFEETGDATAWATWITRFETVANIAGWNAARMKAELKAGMSGAAALVTRDIDIQDHRTFAQVKADYQDRFITPADSDQARADFSLAQQGAEESLLEFHSRLRELFTRAYPAAMGNIDGAPMGQILRDRFISGLLNPAIKEYTWDQRPANYMECLAVVQRKQATLQLLSPSSQGPNNQANGSSTNPRSQAPSSVYSAGASTFGNGNPNAGANFTCHFCKTTGHMLRQCPLLDQARSIIEGTGGGSMSRGGFRRGFGRGRGRGGRGARGGARGGGSRGAGGDEKKKKGPQLSSLGAQEEDDEKEEEDDSAQADDEYSESEN